MKELVAIDEWQQVGDHMFSTQSCIYFIDEHDEGHLIEQPNEHGLDDVIKGIFYRWVSGDIPFKEFGSLDLTLHLLRQKGLAGAWITREK